MRIDWAELMVFKLTFTEPAPRRFEQQPDGLGASTLHGAAHFTDPPPECPCDCAVGGAAQFVLSGHRYPGFILWLDINVFCVITVLAQFNFVQSLQKRRADRLTTSLAVSHPVAPIRDWPSPTGRVQMGSSKDNLAFDREITDYWVVGAGTARPWVLSALGAPLGLVGLLVPLRESGSLIPQAMLAQRWPGLPVCRFAPV